MKCFLRDNPIDDADLELYFSSNFEILGKVEEYELKPNGKQIKVTDENKHEYLRFLLGCIMAMWIRIFKIFF